MTSNRDIEFWTRVPVPERTRLVHTLVKGARELVKVMFYEDAFAHDSSDDLVKDILDVTQDVTMSLWDYVGSA